MDAAQLPYPDNTQDRTTPRWDMSQERAFIENLLGQRFNFLLVFFSIVVAGSVQARELPLLQALVLTLGAGIVLCLTLVIARAQQKLDIILGLLFENQQHPARVANDRARGGSRRKLIGYVVPRICFCTLAIWTAASWLDVFGILHLNALRRVAC